MGTAIDILKSLEVFKNRAKSSARNHLDQCFQFVPCILLWTQEEKLSVKGNKEKQSNVVGLYSSPRICKQIGEMLRILKKKKKIKIIHLDILVLTHSRKMLLKSLPSPSM